ncbi:MAG: oxidoreductase [Xanthobacteraceae bacterium]
MSTFTEEEVAEAVALRAAHPNTSAAAAAAGINRSALRRRLARAAELGLLPKDPVMPGFMIKSVASRDGDAWVKQVRDHGDEFSLPEGHAVKAVSALVDGEGRVIQQWLKTHEDREQALGLMRAALEGFKADLPRASVVIAPPAGLRADLLNQFTVTDMHLGMLSWREETGTDYDLDIAERLLMDWFAAAVGMSPMASTAILAQIGDLLHHDGMESKTPASGHILDADSRLQKIIRVAIRCLRRIVAMLLEKHDRVHIIMADANHDPAGEAWLREMFAAFYEDEPRVTVDSSASTYYVFEHGEVSLFYHHGHKRKITDVDSIFAGKFRGIYGRTKYSYAHLGHLHSDALASTNLMKVERHETLAAPDAYAANGGWLSGRSAKVITYHKRFGEVSRVVLTPEMVARGAANDNGADEWRVAA